jgi:hypothetical protein
MLLSVGEKDPIYIMESRKTGLQENMKVLRENFYSFAVFSQNLKQG